MEMFEINCERLLGILCARIERKRTRKKEKSDEQRGKIPARQGTPRHNTHWFAFSFLSLLIRACHAKGQSPGVVASFNSSWLLTYSHFYNAPPPGSGTNRRWQELKGYSYPFSSCHLIRRGVHAINLEIDFEPKTKELDRSQQGKHILLLGHVVKIFFCPYLEVHKNAPPSRMGRNRSNSNSATSWRAASRGIPRPKSP